jgi:hypothetical protein
MFEFGEIRDLDDMAWRARWLKSVEDAYCGPFPRPWRDENGEDFLPQEWWRCRRAALRRVINVMVSDSRKGLVVPHEDDPEPDYLDMVDAAWWLARSAWVDEDGLMVLSTVH